MTAKKQREKDRRRASKLAREAWDAAECGRLELALKIIRRAVDLHPSNPLLWHDQGALLLQLHKEDEAARSFQAAIQVAPDFAEGYASLAAIRARRGLAHQATALVREAVRRAPDVRRYRDALLAYAAQAAGGHDSDSRQPPQAESVAAPRYTPADDGSATALKALPDRMAYLDWPGIEAALTRRGLAHIRGLLEADACVSLRALFDDEARFAKTVTMNKPRFGKGVYRYFAAPLPPLVDALRHSLYPHVAIIVNRWQELLKDHERFPPTWPEFRARCAAAGQATPSPLLLRYEAGGFNALHQDVRGDVFFPLQLVVVLSRRADATVDGANAFTGGEFLFCDQPERKPSDRLETPAGLGDAILFCTRARLVPIADAYGLQPVKHGLKRVASGVRLAIGVPFHDFR